MASFISEISNYAFVVIMAVYVATNIIVFFFKNPEKHKHFYMLQTLLAIAFHAVGFITLFVRAEDVRYFFFFAFQEIILFALILVFRTLYRSVSRLMLNNVLMLLFVGFIILGRLAFENAVRQFVITIVAFAVSMIIPWIMKHTKLLKKMGYVYCTLGILALGAVWLTGEITNGSKLAFKIEGMSFQPSEFVKIVIVFFIAALLANKKDPFRYVSSGLFSLVHVLILVLSRDLGGAGIYCMIYLFMLYIANRNAITLLVGAVGGAGAFYLALQIFDHVKIRVQNWLNPWTDMSNTGYQITQSLFAIGTGGWEGMGLFQGNPKTIPYVNEDFVFSAIAEEFGVMFSVLLIMLYLVTVLHMFRMSARVKEFFHKLILSGLAVSLGTQVILTVGGGTRFIPLTGVTLPLISMGGSYLCATLLMFGVVQGIYIKEFAYYEEDYEEDEFEEDEFDEEEEYEYEEDEYAVAEEEPEDLDERSFVENTMPDEPVNTADESNDEFGLQELEAYLEKNNVTLEGLTVESDEDLNTDISERTVSGEFVDEDDYIEDYLEDALKNIPPDYISGGINRKEDDSDEKKDE